LVAKVNDDGTTRFFVVGDWGGLPTSPYDTPSEVTVAAAMGQLGVKLNTSFQLALGDNFYYDGVKSATDPRFEVQFFLEKLFEYFKEFSFS
jgi:tartrate-resistant acid phosphatase type 5